MKKILIFCHWYLPGYKGGGPIRTISNMVQALGDKYSFYIVCADHDLGENVPYQSVKKHEWNQIGKAYVWYLAASECNWHEISALLYGNHDWDIVYFQSFWDFYFTQLPLFILRFSNQNPIPILLAPRGEFCSGALHNKFLKKKIFLWVFKICGGHREICFHGSTEDEAFDIRNLFPCQNRIFYAMDFPAQIVCNQPAYPEKKNGTVRVCFLARIVPQKNLLFCLQVMRMVNKAIVFDIYGPIEDRSYYHACQKEFDAMTADIAVRYCGEVMPDKVIPLFAQYDLFFLPTLSENFGHVIHESLLAGTPVLCSDQTPWHELELRGAGWEIPLDQPTQFAKVLNHFIDLSEEQRQQMRRAAYQYGIDVSHNTQILNDNLKMFETILNG